MLTGCKKYLDVNSNPNSLSVASEALILSPMEEGMSSYVCGGYNAILANYWMQNMTLNQAVRYTAGPKEGLTVFFWAAIELDQAIRAAGFAPILWLRPQSTWRDPAELGQWLQWEGIYYKA